MPMSGQGINPPRGVHDILPTESSHWQVLEKRLNDVVESACYREIRVPIFEHTELFKRGVGDTTDIVNKEMYSFLDRSDRSLTLRPEGTAGVVRAYLSNGLHRQPVPVKLWYRGPMFRYERTQTGRQRQFHQLGIEAFGSEGPTIDAEVIVLAYDCLRAAGVENFRLELNSIGCQECRPAYRAALKEFLRPLLSNLCHDCVDRFERNPLRMLDCKQPGCQANFTNVPASLDHLCQDCQTHWDALKAAFAAIDLPFEVNPRLVRGLDYYTRTVFEFVTEDKRLGAQATICAGGRYDGLVETLGGPHTPAVGWALGIERLILLSEPAIQPKPQVFVVADSSAAALALACRIRRCGLSCEMDFPSSGSVGRGFSKQFQQASRLGAAWTVIQGADEAARGEVSVKNMASGEQTAIKVEALAQFLRELG